jgi:tetratricopeptide (TPR) repeat protein
MNKITILLSVIGICFFSCREHVQPKSLSADSIGSIEKAIGDLPSNESKNLSLETQLHILMHETESISQLSKRNQSADSIIDLETEITRLSAILFMENDPEKIFTAIAAILFDKLKITFEKNENDLNAVFPYRIIQSRRGTCLGISLLVLQIGERLGFPIYGVLVPGHFFVRYDDGIVKRNFEPLRHGENMPEQWYRQKWPTNDIVRYSLRNYTKNEVVGVVCYTIGNSLMFQGKNKDAIHFFTRAKGELPDFIEASGNEAVAYDKIGETRKAIAILGELIKKKPTLDRIHSRYAPLLLKGGRYSDAEIEYGLALEDEPENTDLLYGYAMTLFQLKKCADASEVLSRALVLKPDFEFAGQLSTEIQQQCSQ